MQADSHYQSLLQSIGAKQQLLGILIDPDKFEVAKAKDYIGSLPERTTHILVGGSTVAPGQTEEAVKAIREHTDLPIWLFPGDHHQLTDQADVLMFLSLLSGRNPEFLIGQQVQAAAQLQGSKLEIIPTAYLLLDGGQVSAVERVTGTKPMPQDQVDAVVHTALAGQLMGAQMLYLEAGSGAIKPVRTEIIERVRESIDIPLIVGGGIRSEEAAQAAYRAGADMVIMGTHFETTGE